MPRIQKSKLNKGYQRKLQALRKSLGKKIGDLFMPRIQTSKLNKGHQRKLKALRKSLGKKIADEAFSKWLKEVASGKNKASKIDPVAARLAGCIVREDKKKKLKLPRGGYLIRRGFQGVILAEAVPTKPKKAKATAKPKKTKAAIKPKKKVATKPKNRNPAAKKAAPKKKAARKKR